MPLIAETVLLRQSMTMILMRIVCMLALAFGPIVSTPASAAVSAPTGKWVVDYEDQACVATRQYGTEAKPLFLALKPSPIGDVMQLSVIRKRSSDSLGVEEFGRVSFDQRRDVPVSMLSFAPVAACIRPGSISQAKTLPRCAQPDSYISTVRSSMRR